MKMKEQTFIAFRQICGSGMNTCIHSYGEKIVKKQHGIWIDGSIINRSLIGKVKVVQQ